MSYREFCDYLKSYCEEVGKRFPPVGKRLMYKNFNTRYKKVGDQLDIECALWGYFDEQILMIKPPSERSSHTSSTMIKETMNTIQTNAFVTLAYAECKPAPAPVTFGNMFPPAKKCKPVEELCCKQEKKEDNMSIYNELEASRKYLNSRLCDVSYTQRDNLRKIFRLDNPSVPTTYKTLIDAIQNNKFEIVKKVADRVDEQIEDSGRYYGSAFDGIKFKLDDAPDVDGFHAADKAMEKVRMAAKDVINTSDAAAGLKALQDFEAWTPTVGNATAQ